MEVDERARHELYEDVKQVIGVGSADALMRYLPPVGWGDVATRRDLELLEARIDVKIAALRTDFGDVRADVADRFRTQTVTFVTMMAALNGITIAILKFT